MADDVTPLLADDLAPEAHHPAQAFIEQGANAGDAPYPSTKVGFTLRDSRNEIVDAFAFLINPQGLDISRGSRSQLFGTRSRIYVNNFGGAPTSIQLRQLVASGKVVRDGFYTAREDVQRFITTIYEPAIDDTGPERHAYFHDNHLERGYSTPVWFGPESLVIQRSVELQGVWLVQLQMVGLAKQPFDRLDPDPSPTRIVQGKRIRIKARDTLTRLAVRVAGRHASPARQRLARDAILALNPELRKRRKKPDGTYAKPLQVYPGEIIRLPA